jgi:dihydroorotate dehydrogenase (fumarate)
MKDPLSVQLGDVRFEHPLMNGAGYCKDEAHVKELIASASSAVVLGSITVEPRTGNHGDVYFTSRYFALNSLGIPNRGATFFQDKIPSMAQEAHAAGKPLIVNIAGFSVDDYGRLATVAREGGADLLEVNFGCPNIWSQTGEQKRIFSFDPKTMSEILEVLQTVWEEEQSITVKLSPYSDPALLKEVAAIVANYQSVIAITTTNTFPNAFAYNDAGRPAITLGLAGLSGPVMKAVGLGQVIQFRAVLPQHIAIIGVGGITSGKDMLDYLKAGATAVQLTTALINEGPNVFSRILSEYIEIAGLYRLSATA